MKMLW